MQYYLLYFSLIYVLIYDELELKKHGYSTRRCGIIRASVAAAIRSGARSRTRSWSSQLPTPTPCSAYVKGEADKKETRARITGLHLHDT